MDTVMTALEEEKEAIRKDTLASTHLKVFVDLIWAKVDYYYRLSDRSPAYTSAIILHPQMKLQWLQKRWADHEAWWKTAEANFRKLAREYADDYSVKTSYCTPCTPQHARKRRRRTNRPDDDLFSSSDVEAEGNIDDEIDRYFSLIRPNLGRDKKGKQVRLNIITWWWEQRAQFPTLSRMALDLAAVPPSSADLERRFSDAGNTITDKRNRLKPETVQAIECLKSVFRELPGEL